MESTRHHDILLNRHTSARRGSAGFTLVELMVVTAIIGIITVMAILNQNTFNKTITLVNTAYDIALTIRSTQGLGLGNRISGSTLNVGYGIHFDKVNQDSFRIFADTFGSSCPSTLSLDCHPGDKSFSDQDTTVQTVSIGNGITISKFCAITAAGNTCSTDLTSPIPALDIVFTRPNSDVVFTAGGSTNYSAACFTLLSPSGTTRTLMVSSSGSIVVQSAGSTCS